MPPSSRERVAGRIRGWYAARVRDQLERCYEAGHHRRARALAQEILQSDPEPELADRARRVLQATEPDPFLTLVGALGLGLLAWLVYNYVL